MDKYTIRMATARDLDIVLSHRRRMFEDMGFTDPQATERMLSISTPLIGQGLNDRTYRGWLAETSETGVVAGAGVIVLTSSPIQRTRGRNEPGS